jgi:CHAD domain-containing protein
VTDSKPKGLSDKAFETLKYVVENHQPTGKNGAFGAVIEELGEQKDQEICDSIKQDLDKPWLREPDPELLALAERAVQAKEKEDELLSKMSPAQRRQYIEKWAQRLAQDIVDAND